YISTLLHFLSFLLHEPPPPEIYTLSLHDALPISREWRPDCDVDQERRRESGEAELHPERTERPVALVHEQQAEGERTERARCEEDRKSTRLNPVTFRSRMPSSA